MFCGYLKKQFLQGYCLTSARKCGTCNPLPILVRFLLKSRIHVLAASVKIHSPEQIFYTFLACHKQSTQYTALIQDMHIEVMHHQLFRLKSLPFEGTHFCESYTCKPLSKVTRIY
ncbi:hypothetical protein VCRA2118O144_40138 [Vibrio crassostreae]|nr:hypothetical protein VCRA2118O144_40138 [Vibrio crassostreae]CAK4005481.1 hypothetical protein VCRA2120O254_50141 [Vibrio crassostreae]